VKEPAQAAAEAVAVLVDKQAIANFLLLLDLGGTFVFAISGAMVGVKQRLDIFGVLVLSFAAAAAGGVARDLLIGAVPPAAISDWRYFAVAMTAGLVTFLWSSPLSKLHSPIQLLDAVGLAFFAVAGAEKALAFRLDPLMAALLGMLTAIGGGITRDLLVASTPSVLKGDLYAVAALAGAGLVVTGNLLGWPVVPTAIAAGVLGFAIRLLAIRRGWGLPVADFAQRDGPDRKG
jgi:uncharacterized membrane protein YeiH